MISSNSYKNIAASASFENWSDYIDASLQPSNPSYDNLHAYGLAFGQRMYGVDFSTYLQSRVYQYA